MPSFLLGITSLVLVLVATSTASCWSALGYHAAASALATGIGDLQSAGVCVYNVKGNNSALDAECPPPCKALLVAVWGDCYCQTPSYRPLAWGADKLVYNMTVRQMFDMLATRRYVAAAYCREWLGDNTHVWEC